MIKDNNSGLDIDFGVACSKDAATFAKTTLENRKNIQGAIKGQIKDASANILAFGDQKIGISSDGIGTKIELAERCQIYDTLGFDLVAMVADDLATAGLEPTTLSNILDVNFLDKKIIQQLMKGLANACNFANISISGGEIAELGNRVNGYGTAMNFNWGATALGVLPAQLSQAINGNFIKENQAIVALQSNGFRSNGFSLIRRIMTNKLGEDWHQVPYDTKRTWGQTLLSPSLIYSPLINNIITANIQLTGIAHITGGGIVHKLKRVLHLQQLGAVLDNLYQPNPAMIQLIKLGQISLLDAYLYWNMGNGMLLITDKKQVPFILQKAKKMNYSARLVGKITATNTPIIIDNKKLGFLEKY